MSKIGLALFLGLLSFNLVLGGSALFAGEHGGKEHGGKSESASSGTPSGWTQGKKTGWDGAGRPPGQVKKVSKSKKSKTQKA